MKRRKDKLHGYRDAVLFRLDHVPFRAAAVHFRTRRLTGRSDGPIVQLMLIRNTTMGPGERRKRFLERHPNYDRDRKRRERAAIKALHAARAMAAADALALAVRRQPLALPAPPVRLALPAPVQEPLFILPVPRPEPLLVEPEQHAEDQHRRAA